MIKHITCIFIFFVGFTSSLYSQDWNDKFTAFQNLTNQKQWPEALSKGVALKADTEQSFGKNHLNYTTILSWLGFVQKNLGQFTEAEQNYLESLEISKKILVNSSLDMLYPLQDLAYFYYDNKEFAKAIPFYEGILELLKTPESNTNYWSYFTELAQCYYNSSDVANALEFYEVLEQNISNPTVQQFITLPKIWTNLGNLYSSSENNTKADVYLLKALDHCKNNNQNCIVPLENLANHYLKIKDYNKALPYYLESYKLQSNSASYDRYYQLLTENIAICYLNIGDLTNFKTYFLINCNYLNQTKPDYASSNYIAWRNSIKSRNDYDLELYILENHLNYITNNSPNHPDYPVILYNTGMTYWNQNNFLKAEEYYKKSLDYNLIKNDNLDNVLRCIKSYSKILVTNSKYNEAYQWFVKRDALTQEKFSKSSIEYGSFLIDFAKLHNKTNKQDRALELIEQAETILKLYELPNEITLEILNVKVDVFTAINQHQKAAPLLAQGLEIAEKDKDLLGYQILFLTKMSDFFEMANYYDQTISLLSNNILKLKERDLPDGIIDILNSRLAFAYYRKGNFSEAENIYQDILPTFEETYGKKHVYYRNALNKYVMLLSQTGQHQKALDIYLTVEHQIEELPRKEQATFLFNLASLYKDLKNNAQAINYYHKFLDFYLDEINENFLFLSESEKENYVLSVAHNYHHLFNFYHNLNDKSNVINDMYRLHSAFKGMILSASIDLKKQWDIMDNPKTIGLLEQFKSQKYILNQLLLDGNSSQTTEVQNKLDDLERELSRNIPDYKNKKVVSVLDFENITKQLNEDEILLDFVQFEMGSLFEWYNDQQYGVFIISGKTEPQYLPLFTQSELNDILQPESSQNNANQLYRGSKVTKSNQNSNYGAQLYELIWKPIEANLQQQQTIYYLPAGTLHQIALAAIPVNNERVLMEDYRLYQRNNSKAIKEESNTPENINYLLFGGIDYNANLFDKSNSSNTWSYLEGTKIEIDELAKSIKSNKTMLSSNEATEKAFKESVSNNQPKIIHIATHGFFYSKPDKKLANITSTVTNMLWESSDNPMLRSGLLFAGANYNWQESNVNIAENDGIATALEINDYNLNNTKLVVLSACETGLGDISGSEGVFGLQRAFKNAGAEYLLMSLWKVPDSETAEFMIYFYDQLTQSQNIEQSFHNTQKYMKNKYPKDPYNWAAFVLVR